MQLKPEFTSGEQSPAKSQQNPAVQKFPLGKVVATSNAAALLKPADIQTALCRHQLGDWGNLDSEDRQANEDALKNEGRLLSVYNAVNGTKFYVITEWDRLLTTVLLPTDY